MVENKDEIFKSRMFARQQLIEGWNQETLSNSTMMIVGVGALGCEIAKDFALMGLGKVILVDLDTIEISNLSRQMLFRPGDEGRPKAEVAAERLKEMNPYLNVDFYFEKLQKLPSSVFEESDVRLKKPMVEGGTVGFEGHVQIVIPKGSKIQYRNRDKEIDKIVDSKLWDLDERDFQPYYDGLREIEELEDQIDKIVQSKITPVRAMIRKKVEEDFDRTHSEEVLNLTPCYRCLIPIPPADDKLIAACTLKGLPRNRNHCVIKAEVNFEKKHGFRPDMTMDDDVVKLKELAQEELVQLRERVFNENVPPEKLETIGKYTW
ncbi:MAG: ThiF family adenylyltransferase [Promethearchaeota archaeon]